MTPSHTHWPRLIERRLTEDSGFTMIELLVAIFVLVIGILGIATTFADSGKLTTVAEKTEVATYQGQRELERIKALAYGDVALTSSTVPVGPGAGANNPLLYKFGAAGGGTYDWSQTCTASCSTAETLVTSSDPAHSMSLTTPWQDTGYVGGPSTRLRGTIYRFITFVANDPLCTASCYAGCAAAPTTCYKRITLAITLSKGPPNKPIIMTSFMKPRATANENPLLTPGRQCQTTTASGTVSVPC